MIEVLDGVSQSPTQRFYYASTQRSFFYANFGIENLYSHDYKLYNGQIVCMFK